MTEYYSSLPTYSGDTRLLWIPAAIMFVIGDTMSTLAGIEHVGAVELNPLMQTVVTDYGLVGMLTVKVCALGLMYFMGSRIERTDGHLVGSLTLLAISTLVVTWNTVQITIGL